MGYKNKTNQEYQNDYYLENKYRKQQYYNQNYKKKKETRHEYYLQNRDYIRVYQYLYYRHKKYENDRDSDKILVVQNNFNISLEE